MVHLYCTKIIFFYILTPATMILTNIFAPVIDLFLPRLCPGCGQSMGKGDLELCIHCLSVLPETRFYLSRNNPLSRRLDGRFRFEQAVACYYFHKSTILQNIIHQFKYKGNKNAALFMGEQMGKLFKSSSVFQLPDAIVPIPLHLAKQKKRGYNQSELLGKGIAEVLNIPVFTTLLKRTIQTQTQTKLTAIERWKNVEKAFMLNPNSISPKQHILLVDDVITSGATMEACAHVLEAVKGIKVSIAALSVAEY